MPKRTEEQEKWRARVYEKCWADTDGRCWYCGERTRPNHRQVDHVVARAKGGSDNDENLVAACSRCNAHKTDMSLETYRQLLSRKADGRPYFLPAQLAWLKRQGIRLPPIAAITFFGETLAKRDGQ